MKRKRPLLSIPHENTARRYLSFVKQKYQPSPETQLGDTIDTGHGASRGKPLSCLFESLSFSSVTAAKADPGIYTALQEPITWPEKGWIPVEWPGKADTHTDRLDSLERARRKQEANSGLLFTSGKMLV